MAIGNSYFKSSITTNLEGLTPTSNYILYGTGSGWATTISPTLTGLDLTGITNSYIPYMSASGFADTILYSDGVHIGIGVSLLGEQLLDLYNNAADAIVQTVVSGNYFPRFRMERRNGTTKTNVQWELSVGTPGALDFIDKTNQIEAALRIAPNYISYGLNILATGTQIGPNESPYLTLYNSTEENSDGGRESRIIAKGEQDGGEESVLGWLEFAHDGAADDEKGKFTVMLNDGNDAAAPSIVGMEIDCAGNIKAGTATISDNSGNLTSANGLASFDGAVTNITVVNGIITAAS